MENIRFVDEALIYLKAGKGGEGSSARRRFRSHFVNWGGDGGRGGSIYIQADGNIFDLSKYLNKNSFRAPCGFCGSSNNKKGRDAQDLVLKVPAGTFVKNMSQETLFDLADSKERYLLVQGGSGGKGNWKRRHTVPASEGQEINIILDLRIIADVAILGATNAGKSTLISQVTNLTPRISEFPFTTKNPIWAVAKKDYKIFTILELPAIIGKKNEPPPGVKFLKHLKRVKVIVFLFDSLQGSLEQQLNSLIKVLDDNGIDYRGKYVLKVVNKVDKIKEKLPRGYFPIEAETGHNLDQFISKIFDLLDK